MPIFPKKSTSRFIVLFLFVMLALSGIGYSIYLVAFGVHDINTLFIAMIFLSLTLISGFFNIFIANSYYRSAFYNEYLDGINKGLKPLKSFPTVAIVVPVFNEEVAVVKTNVLQLKTMNYPKERLSFYLLDDSTDSEKASELRLFARSNGIRYVHRKDRKGFKAGALNNMLKHSKEEFLAVFDFDEYLTIRTSLWTAFHTSATRSSHTYRPRRGTSRAPSSPTRSISSMPTSSSSCSPPGR